MPSSVTKKNVTPKKFRYEKKVTPQNKYMSSYRKKSDTTKNWHRLFYDFWRSWLKFVVSTISGTWVKMSWQLTCKINQYLTKIFISVEKRKKCQKLHLKFTQNLTFFICSTQMNKNWQNREKKIRSLLRARKNSENMIFLFSILQGKTILSISRKIQNALGLNISPSKAPSRPTRG